MQIDRQDCTRKIAKVGQKGCGLRYVSYFYNLCTQYYIIGTAERTNLKFGA